MTSSKNTKASPVKTVGKGKSSNVQIPGKLKASPTFRHKGAELRASVKAPSKTFSAEIHNTHERSLKKRRTSVEYADVQEKRTAIEQCVQSELRRYFEMLDGEEPAHLYRMVIRQAESALISTVMEECRGNQTRASEWLGISRGNLRTKLANMDK